MWTTFFPYQWDLNWDNPRVFAAVLETILWLANRGIEIFRLDAVPFMGKRLGTSCMNQPEVHDIVQALHALTKLAAPAVVFKAEAIVAPDDLVAYLGGHHRYRPECELAYHNQLMVMLWSSLATKDARLAVQSLRRLRPIPAETSWATYVRCHDDIGWAVGDIDARAVGYDPFAHRDFLNAFYSGRFPMSYARGALFGENPQPGDARISGSAAALCGISDGPGARRRTSRSTPGIRRLVLLHAVALGWGGVPLLYMGDELAQGNDATYRADPALAEDNRWMHRPYFDDAAAARRHDPGTVEGRVFGWFRALVAHPGAAARAARGRGVGGAGDGLAARARPGVAGIRAAASSSGWPTSRTSPRPSTSACSTGSAGSTPCWPRDGAAAGARTAGSGWPGWRSSGSPRSSRFVATIRIAQFGRVPCAPTVEVGESDMAESAAPPQEARPRPAEETPLHPALGLGARRHRRGHLGRAARPRVRQAAQDPGGPVHPAHQGRHRPGDLLHRDRGHRLAGQPGPCGRPGAAGTGLLPGRHGDRAVHRPARGQPRAARSGLPGAALAAAIEQANKSVATGESDQGLAAFLQNELFPTSFLQPFVDNKVLQVLVLAILTACSISFLSTRMRERAVAAIDGIAKVIFGIIKIIMWAAPLAAFGGMAYTVSAFGASSLANLGLLMLTFWGTCAFFVLVVLGAVSAWAGFNILKLIRLIKDELLIIVGTSSSETVLPRLLTKLESAGASRQTVGLVIPTGYSFNLDGTCIYLTLGALFIIQAGGEQLGIGPQIALAVLMVLTSKGAAGVTGAGLVTLAASLEAFGGQFFTAEAIAVGIALVVGIDRVMSEGRALTNAIGNCVATLVIARWNGELDRERLQAVLDDPSLTDDDMELHHGSGPADEAPDPEDRAVDLRRRSRSPPSAAERVSAVAGTTAAARSRSAGVRARGRPACRPAPRAGAAGAGRPGSSRWTGSARCRRR